MLPDNETKLEIEIATLKNMQEARRASAEAEEARILSRLEARRAYWHVEVTSRAAKIAALERRLLTRRADAESQRIAEAAARARYEKRMANARAAPPAPIAAPKSNAPPWAGKRPLPHQ